MSQKNHKMTDGKLLQTDKKYAQLKLKQKEKIAEWMFQVTRDYYTKNYTFPNDRQIEKVVNIVYEKIEEAEIWVPYGEVLRHYKSKRSAINRRVRKELNEKEENRNEKVCFMNMCMVQDDKGNVKQVVIVSLESKQVEGRMQMVPVKGSEKTLDADIVLIAAGFVGCEDYVAKAFDVKLTPRGNVADENYQTNQKQLYVAGDMRRGQSLVVWAIREGREVARAVDEDLMGYSNL